MQDKFSRNIWSGKRQNEGDKIEYEGRTYKVIWCNTYPFSPPICKGYQYYLTVSEVV